VRPDAQVSGAQIAKQRCKWLTVQPKICVPNLIWAIPVVTSNQSLQAQAHSSIALNLCASLNLFEQLSRTKKGNTCLIHFVSS